MTTIISNGSKWAGEKPEVGWGKYRTQYNYRCPVCSIIVEPYYYAAFNCINFAHKSERIGDRKVPLRPNTMRRVNIGIDRFWDHPFVIYGGDNKKKNHSDRIYGLDQAIPTQCAQPWHQVISPKPFIVGSGWDKLSSSERELYTQTAHQNFGVVSPPFLIQNNGQSTVNDLGNAIPTQVGGKKHALIYPPFICRNTNPGGVRGIAGAIGTQIASAQHSVISYPFQIELNRTGTARNLTEPISTQLGGGKHNAIITPESWQMFIGHYYNGAHDNQNRHITDTVGACTTKQRHYAITMKAGEKVKPEDCYYRMIRSDEVGSAMAFDKDYIVHGDERQKVRQYGNAVTPPVMQWIIERCVQSLK